MSVNSVKYVYPVTRNLQNKSSDKFSITNILIIIVYKGIKGKVIRKYSSFALALVNCFKWVWIHEYLSIKNNIYVN
jgi:hypothetical protein